jgi:hypothetical protein
MEADVYSLSRPEKADDIMARLGTEATFTR